MTVKQAIKFYIDCVGKHETPIHFSGPQLVNAVREIVYPRCPMEDTILHALRLLHREGIITCINTDRHKSRYEVRIN